MDVTLWVFILLEIHAFFKINKNPQEITSIAYLTGRRSLILYLLSFGDETNSNFTLKCIYLADVFKQFTK